MHLYVVMHLYEAVVSLVCASSSAASSSAFQPTEQVSVDELQALICQVRDFKAKYGKFPIFSRKNQDEKNLAQKIAWNESKLTSPQKQELKQLRDGAFQPVAEVHVVDLQALICEVRDWIAKHGKFPIRSRTNKDENNLAKRLLRNKYQFTAAQKLELKELKEGTASDYFLRGENLINEVKKLGYYPRECQPNMEESRLATRLRQAFNTDLFFQPDEFTWLVCIPEYGIIIIKFLLLGCLAGIILFLFWMSLLA